MHDLEIHSSTANGINADDGGETANPLASHHLVFRRLSIHDIGSGGNNDCLKLSGIYDFWVLDSTIARCGGGASGSGIDCVGCHEGLIARNRLRADVGQRRAGERRQRRPRDPLEPPRLAGRARLQPRRLDRLRVLPPAALDDRAERRGAQPRGRSAI